MRPGDEATPPSARRASGPWDPGFARFRAPGDGYTIQETTESDRPRSVQTGPSEGGLREREIASVAGQRVQRTD